MTTSLITDLLATFDIRVEYRSQSSLAWETSLSNLEFIPVSYSNSEIDYQIAYMRGGGLLCEDISMIIFNDNRPCGVWPLCISDFEGITTVNSYLHYGQLITPPIFFKKMPNKSVKSLTKKCLDFVNALCRLLKIESWQSGESYINGLGLSDWYEQSLLKGGKSSLRHELFVDLNPSMVDIKAKFRRSYKSLISEGMRIWSFGVQRDTNHDLWNSFRLLHLSVAGKSTRCDYSWELQHEAIAKGSAFLVHLHDRLGRLVGGGFFAVTRDQGVYNVGAYDRKLFANPVGHLVQYLAIEEMKSRGIIWYKIGLRNYAQEQNVSPKQVAIGEFIQGFSSHLFPKFLVRHNLNAPII
jgi:FemAB family protein